LPASAGVENVKEKIIKNPISSLVKEFVGRADEDLSIAVPFISSFARTILSSDKLTAIKSKRLVTRFDETNILCFDLPTLTYLLDQGFKIKFDNEIHLKLFVNDKEAIVSSSNLTQGGFENNFELSVKVDDSNVSDCRKIFDDLWNLLSEKNITKDLIKENWEKYELLKKKDRLKKTLTTLRVSDSQTVESKFNVGQLLDMIIAQQEDYSSWVQNAYEANKRRAEVKIMLKIGFDPTIFYVEKDHALRKKTLFYDFVYGFEKKLAGTGLREKQFKTVFEHATFKDVISFILPEMYALKPWEMDDPNTLQVFCNGLFDFQIPEYAEAIPIRLASYFYPEHFIQIFTLKDLKKICEPLGIDTNANTKGDRLCAYNIFLKQKLKSIPYDIYVKSHLAYQFSYTNELFNRLSAQETYDAIINSYDNTWEQGLIEHGRTLLKKMEVIK